jgi:hypothetical protein
MKLAPTLMNTAWIELTTYQGADKLQAEACTFTLFFNSIILTVLASTLVQSVNTILIRNMS